MSHVCVKAISGNYHLLPLSFVGDSYIRELNYTALFVVAIVSITAAVNSSSAETCSSLSNIETTLAKLSAQFSQLPPSSSESSLTGVTSLLQLSLLKELLGEYKKGPDNDEGLALLYRIELILNNTMTRLDAIESHMISMESRMLSSIQRNTQQLLAHSNLTQTTFDTDNRLPDDTELSDDYTPSPLLRSCQEVLHKWPSSSSGYYKLADASGHARHVYCHMETLCNKGGGWMRVSHLNMTDSKEKCPNVLRLYQQNGVRACGRPTSSSGSCSGVTFPVHFKYSQVCGKVIGYQKGCPDGTYFANNMDGIRLTHGNSRSHIWSFIAGCYEGVYPYCPCASSGKSPPSYVGNDYYCESGNHNIGYNLNQIYSNDPLWDGEDCRSLESLCCERTLIPWFHKSLGHSTTDYIEMRFCFDEGSADEDSPVEEYEIYVK